MSESNKAVFLSYASQDAEAARRICDALRAAGVEVWFDQSELRGGDTWDHKIRKQIKECALFMPVISATTQARGEGYFRLEWKLAVDRSHLMADDAAFLFPVVIDDIPDAAARVPDKFREVQWTRLSVVHTPETLAVRVGKLLAGAPVESRRGDAQSMTSQRDKTRSWFKVIVPLAGLAFGLIFALRGMWAPSRRSAARPEPVAPLVAPVSEARQLTAKARAMSLDKYNSTADDYAAAEGLIKRALELDANDGETWAVSSLLNSTIRSRGFDRAPARREAARREAERALKLAPDSVDGRYALARWQRDSDPTMAEQTFKDVLARNPGHAGALGSLGTMYQWTGRFDEAMALFHRLEQVPEWKALAFYSEFLANFGRAHFAEAEHCIRASIAAEPSANSIGGLAMLLLTRYGDAAGAVRELASAPAASRSEHRIVWMTAYAQLAARQPDDALRTLDRLSADFVQDNWFVGPKAYWVGRAHAQAGRPDAARLAFEEGLTVA
ncbi:MAG: invasion protein regulator, partial [Verrucomicrobia bacterium]|nr:invasion protein regulator [Verrucomicrobiota bacterium]